MTDLRGFTTLSEQMDSHKLVKQLNEYLTLMVGDVFAFKGPVDHYGEVVFGNIGSAQKKS